MFCGCFSHHKERPEDSEDGPAPRERSGTGQGNAIWPPSPDSPTEGGKGLVAVCAEMRYGTYTVQDVARVLDDGANPNSRDANTNAALHHTCNVSSKALEENFLQSTELLLLRRADPSAVGWCGTTPLHSAATVSHVPTIELLLEHKANLHAENSNKQRPLHLAALGGFGPCVHLLLNSKADAAAQDCEGMTALDLAKAQGKQQGTPTPSLLLCPPPSACCGHPRTVRCVLCVQRWTYCRG